MYLFLLCLSLSQARFVGKSHHHTSSLLSVCLLVRRNRRALVTAEPRHIFTIQRAQHAWQKGRKLPKGDRIDGRPNIFLYISAFPCGHLEVKRHVPKLMAKSTVSLQVVQLATLILVVITASWIKH